MKTGIIKESNTWWYIIYKNQVWNVGKTYRTKRWFINKITEPDTVEYAITFEYWWNQWEQDYLKKSKWILIFEKI